VSHARLRRDLLLLAGYVERAFLGALGWRTFMLTLVVQTVVPPLVGLAVWTQALPDRPELATYFTVLLFVRLLTVCYEPNTFVNAIYDGTLTNDLLLPRPVVLSVLGDNLAWRLWHVLMALPLLVAVDVLTSVRPAWADLALAVPAMLLAAALRFLFVYALVLTAFWTQRAQAIAYMGGLLVFLLGGEAAPIPLLPEEYRAWAAALPFRAMIGFPAEVAAGLARGPELLTGYAWQLVWLAVLGLVAAQVWRAGVRRYTAVGG
jgi:ABC-2 type transport system permease protein